jgi:hypothetical protein
MSDLRLRAVPAPLWGGIECLLTEDEGRRVGQHVVMCELTPEDERRHFEPTFAMSIQAAQMLMNDLWTCGIRPSNGQGSTGQLDAVQSHLEDMRRLVFTKTDGA